MKVSCVTQENPNSRLYESKKLCYPGEIKFKLYESKLHNPGETKFKLYESNLCNPGDHQIESKLCNPGETKFKLYESKLCNPTLNMTFLIIYIDLIMLQGQ